MNNYLLGIHRHLWNIASESGFEMSTYTIMYDEALTANPRSYDPILDSVHIQYKMIYIVVSLYQSIMS
jgi:hypothetical protein